jgi:hypothetical protein
VPRLASWLTVVIGTSVFCSEMADQAGNLLFTWSRKKILFVLQLQLLYNFMVVLIKKRYTGLFKSLASEHSAVKTYKVMVTGPAVV